jgi:hypothetical protein
MWGVFAPCATNRLAGGAEQPIERTDAKNAPTEMQDVAGKGTRNSIAPEIQPQLQKLILDFALLGDVTEPMCSLVGPDKYMAESAVQLTGLPAHWPQPYRELVQRRIALMESDRNIALIEQPEYKRRWNVEPWDEQLERALREWLLNRLEGCFFGGERMVPVPGSAGCQPAVSQTASLRGVEASERAPENPASRRLPIGDTADCQSALRALRNSFVAGQQPALIPTNQLAAVVETDADFLRVAEIYSGGPGFSVSKLVRELVESHRNTSSPNTNAAGTSSRGPSNSNARCADGC